MESYAHAHTLTDTDTHTNLQARLVRTARAETGEKQFSRFHRYTPWFCKPPTARKTHRKILIEYFVRLTLHYLWGIILQTSMTGSMNSTRDLHFIITDIEPLTCEQKAYEVDGHLPGVTLNCVCA